MNQITYEQLNFDSRQSLFIFIHLTNKSSLSSTIKQVMLKHNNMFVNKLMNITLIYLKYTYINLRFDFVYLQIDPCDIILLIM